MKDFLIEVGLEEVPARLLNDTLDQLESVFTEWIVEQNIDSEFPDSDSDLRVVGTPRRLVVELTLPAEQETITEQIKGPPAHVAYSEGEPTQALRGFCAQHDLEPEAVEVEAMDGGEYVVARKTTPGRPVEKCLRNDLEALLCKLEWPRKMRWEASNFEFIRPLRWLLVFSGDELLEGVRVGPLESAAGSRGLRFTETAYFEPADPHDYFETLVDQGVVLAPADRRKQIKAAAEELAGEQDGEPVFVPGLLEEVTNLVESPAPFLGQFDERFLELPPPVLIETMVAHQKYIPVARPDSDQLLPCFVGVRNGDEKGLDVVRRGNERVLRARLNDAEFFYNKDLQTDYEALRDRLKGVVFQEELGSLYDKTERLGALVENCSELSDECRRVAQHCKNDQVTEMVDELSKLQGTMGRIYARESGWPEHLAQLIEAHYKPDDAEAEIPEDPEGCWLSLLDKLDTLVGFFALGERPTGSADPYGLRRDAVAVLRLALEGEIDFDLSRLVRTVVDEYRKREIEVEASAVADLLEFIRERFYQLLSDRHDFTEAELSAVLAVFAHRPFQAYQRLQWLRDWRGRPEFEAVKTAAQRVGNITADVDADRAPDPEKFRKQAEEELWQAYRERTGDLQAALEAENPDEVLSVYRGMKEPVDNYFEAVMVHCEETDLRQNRLATLRQLRDFFERCADFTQLGQ